MPPETDLKALDGQPVLVKPAIAESQNSVGMRGTIRVRAEQGSGDGPCVEVVLGFPEMFYRPTHEKVIRLSAADVQALLLSRMRGDYELTLSGPPNREIGE
jgi:hypothetical protein